MQGTRLGPYEIQEQLGAGGMGEVWLGTDPRLGRQVAIKVLPGDFAADPERLARFEQEARAAAALNHPHIAVVHDIGEADGTHFMVQELLQGRTLTEALEKGALPLDKALVLGAEIAEALKAAHAAGIVHRDLKPDNVFVTHDNHAKVLDFGLAKLTEAAATPASSATMSPTVVGTMSGAIMGTAGYMAPEQANGEEIDHRADLFAFGCVLYEMVTGQQPFAGDNVYETLGKIVSSEPDRLDAHVDAIPPELQRLVRKCLAKDPARRAWSAGDLVVDLRMLAADVESGAVDTGPALPPDDAPAAASALASPGALAGMAAAALIAALGTWWILRPAEPAPAPIVAFDIELPPGTNFTSLVPSEMAISPDGSAIVFIADQQIWLRRLDERIATPVRNTTGAVDPVFSPDSREIAFTSGSMVRRVNLAGGPLITVGGPITGVAADGPHWAADGYIYVGGEDGGIPRLPAAGGDLELVAETPPGDVPHSPQLLPGNEWLLFALSPGGRADDTQIVVQSMVSGERRTVVAGRQPRYVSTGHLLWVSNGVLLGQPFDAGRLELSGDPVALFDQIRLATGNFDATAHYHLSASGTLLYLEGSGDAAPMEVIWVDPDGTASPALFEPEFFGSARLSPDATRVAVERYTGALARIWIYDIDRPRGQLFGTGGYRASPLWSPDGAWLYFASPGPDAAAPGTAAPSAAFGRGRGNLDLWRQPVDLSREPERLFEARGVEYPESITEDGRLLFFEVIGGPTGTWDIGMVALDGEHVPEFLAATPEAQERFPSGSPDGRFVAYSSDESGTEEIYVLEVGTSRRWLISESAATGPMWLRNGEQIAYTSLDGGRYIVDVQTEPGFDFEPPQRLFDIVPPITGPFRRPNDVTADGQRFLEIRLNAPSRLGNVTQASDDIVGAAPPIHVVVNWIEELKRSVPTGR